MSGLVEAWVWAQPWEDIKNAADLDDGDVARLFCRVADVLRQIGGNDSVAPPLRTSAKNAHAQLYRPPICDLLAV